MLFTYGIITCLVSITFVPSSSVIRYNPEEGQFGIVSCFSPATKGYTIGVVPPVVGRSERQRLLVATKV